MLNSLPIDRLYKNIFTPLKTKYDLIILDCPPAFGQSVSAATCASDFIIAPTDPEEFSLDGLEISIAEFQQLQKRYELNEIQYKILLNKYDGRTNISQNTIATIYHNDDLKTKVFQSIIGINQDFPKAIKAHSSIFDSLRPNNSKKDIDQLTREILKIDLIKTIE